MLKKLKDLKGTASELFQNAAYDQLVNLVGPEGALKALEQSLDDRGLTTDEWRTYRKVRTVMHIDPVDVKRILAKTEELSTIVLGLEA